MSVYVACHLWCFIAHKSDCMQGVEISHKAVIAEVAGFLCFLELVDFELNCKDSQISYLPLAHIFDRCKYATHQ